MMKVVKRLICISVVLCILASCLFVTASAEQTAVSVADDIKGQDTSYGDYIAKATPVYGVSRFYGYPAHETELNGKSVMIVTDTRAAQVQVTVEVAGWYNIGIEFMPYGENDRYELSLSVNGGYPFLQSQNIDIYSAMVDLEASVTETGDDIRPNSVVADTLQTRVLKDSSGYISDAYLYYLEAGANSISLSSLSGELALHSIFAGEVKKQISYKEYLDKMSGKEKGGSASVLIEAENPTLKSNRSIISGTDRSGPDITYKNGSKNEAFALKLNILSEENFKYQNQWVEYEFDIDKSGFYKIAMQVRQTLQGGLFCSRKVYIDGDVPFKEFESVEFPYSDSWYIKTIGDENPYLVWLDEGKHTIRVEATTGDMAKLINEFNAEMDQLNSIYRDIFMVTGSSPSAYMDYDLVGQIDGLLDSLKAVKESISSSLDRLVEISGGRKGTGFSVMDSLVLQLEDFIKNPDTIADRLSSFKDNSTAFGSWVVSLKEQPLGMDSICVCSEDIEPYSDKSGMFDKLIFQIKVLLGSFVSDYDSVSASDTETLNIWVMTGREQAQIVKNLSQNYFEPEHGVKVEISVVSASLVEATLAGTGPDIALFVGDTTPILLGARGVLTDLKTLDRYDELVAPFNPELLVPHTYEGACYGLPLSYDFPMLFYRTDIFEELGLECPQNWEDFYNAVSVIQSNMMTVGVPPSIFATLLHQNGGSYFNGASDTCILDSDEGVAAFKQTTDFYTQHLLPVSYSFYNRFRTGEMPMSIEPYSSYLQLDYAAPEISGLWKMAPIPSNGNTDKYLAGAFTTAVMFEKTANKKAAAQFLSWFTEKSVQVLYGQQLEMILGVVGRYTPANTAAIPDLGWSTAEARLIVSQFDVIKEIPVIPSSYYITRNFDNAFRKVVYSGENPRETLLLYVRDINKEITRKNKAMKRGEK